MLRATAAADLLLESVRRLHRGPPPALELRQHEAKGPRGSEGAAGEAGLTAGCSVPQPGGALRRLARTAQCQKSLEHRGGRHVAGAGTAAGNGHMAATCMATCRMYVQICDCTHDSVSLVQLPRLALVLHQRMHMPAGACRQRSGVLRHGLPWVCCCCCRLVHGALLPGAAIASSPCWQACLPPVRHGIVFGNTTSTRQGIQHVITKEMEGIGGEQAAKAATSLVHRSVAANNAKHNGFVQVEGAFEWYAQHGWKGEWHSWKEDGRRRSGWHTERMA